MTDLDLIQKIKENSDSESFIQLAKRVEKLFFNVCHKYSMPLRNHGIDINDILEAKDQIIYFCVQNFDPTRKSKFSTYVGNYARFLCLNSINARKFLSPSTDWEIFKKIEQSQEDTSNIPNQESLSHLSVLVNQFSDSRISEIFKHRYLGENKMIWKDVANKVGLSSQTVINLNKKGLSILRGKIKSKNLLEFSE